MFARSLSPIPSASASRWRAPLTILASAACIALSCSAPPGSESGDDGVSDYVGPVPGGAAAPAAPGAPAAPSTGAGSGVSPTPSASNEGQGSVPVTNNTNTGANSGSMSSSVPPNTGAPPAGAGGSAMVPPGAGGAGNTPTDPTNAAGAGGTAPAQPPPAQEPPAQQPPAQEPPAQEPPAQEPPTQPPPAEPPPPPPPPVQLPNGLYFQDDFEGGRDPQWTESQIGNGGTFTVDTSLGANGSSSSMRIDSNNAFHTMLQFALPQAVRDSDELFGRVFLRLAATPSQAHFIWVEVGNTTNDQHEMRLGHNVGQLQSNHFLNGEQDIRDQSRSLVADTWYCLEFYMGNNPDELQVFLDNQETALSTTNYTAGPGAQGNGNPVADFIPPLEAFRIGWELQNGTVWFDDVALGSQRIGCN